MELNLNDNQLSALRAMPYQVPSTASPFVTSVWLKIGFQPNPRVNKTISIHFPIIQYCHVLGVYKPFSNTPRSILKEYHWCDILHSTLAAHRFALFVVILHPHWDEDDRDDDDDDDDDDE